MDIQLKDATIYGEVHGEGVPLILLHGNGEDLTIFQNQITYFSSFYKVIAIDTRGHGKSTRGNKPLNFETLSDDVIAVMDQLSIPSAHIIGFSDGGNTALHIALKAPEKIKSMVLVGANLFPSGMKNQVLFSIRLSVYWMKLIFAFDKTIQPKKEQYELMLNHPDLSWSQIASIATLTLVIAGDNDMIKDNHTREIAKTLQHAELEIVPEADHFVLFRKAVLVNERILNFLSTQTHKSN